MSKQDKEQDGVLLKEKIARAFYVFNKWSGGELHSWDDCNQSLYYVEADQLLAKVREAVKGAGLTDKGIASVLRKTYGTVKPQVVLKGEKAIAEAQTKAILKALGGE